jgi:hypothetical protein
MKTKKLYSTNHSVLQTAIRQITNEGIVKFETQAALHCLLEDIKSPHCKRWRNGKVSKPAYAQVNYEPIVDWMLSHGLLRKVEGYRKNVIAYEVTALLPLYSLRTPETTYTI